MSLLKKMKKCKYNDNPGFVEPSWIKIVEGTVKEVLSTHYITKKTHDTLVQMF
jgi:hypothetical protein